MTASASIDSTENVNITISNSDLSNSQDLLIQLNGTIPYSSVTGKVITAPEVTAFNDFGQDEKVNIQSLSDEKLSLDASSLSVQVPSKSVIRLKLTPSTTVAKPLVSCQSILRNYSVKTTDKGIIMIDLKKAPLIPVKLKLYRLDGRIMAETCISSKRTGGGVLQWQPQGINTSDVIYILHIETKNVSTRRKVVFTN